MKLPEKPKAKPKAKPKVKPKVKPKFQGELGIPIELFEYCFDATGNRLDKPILGSVTYNGGTKAETTEKIEDLALWLQKQKIPLLFSHYKVDVTIQGAWLKLVLAMAEDFIPGFQFEAINKETRREWKFRKTGNPKQLSLDLYNLVQLYPSKKKAFESIKKHYSLDFGEDPKARYYEIEGIVGKLYKFLKEEKGYPDTHPIFTFTNGRERK